MTQTRLTTQRMRILEYLKKVKTHPTAEEVHKEIRKSLPTITLATVYRNLNILSEQEQISKLEIKKKAYFDGDLCCHQHCICTKCGKIIDVFQKDISEYAMKKLKVHGFKPECVCITFKGYCKKNRGA